MCGVFGYVGQRADVGGFLMRGLQTLEYRGYDSWGVAIGRAGRVEVAKRAGRIAGARAAFAPAEIGFGHTRWATHGGVTEPNAHPHLDCTGELAVIHNGIVENHRTLRAELERRGHRFTSETDSEVIAHLLEERITAGDDIGAALASVFARLEGLNAVVAMDARTNEMAAVKHVSPLVAGLGDGGAYIASDALALRPHVSRVLYLEDGQLLRMTRDGLVLLDRATLVALPLAWVELSGVGADAALGDYPHFMAKEMAEQPEVLDRLASSAVDQIQTLAAEIASARSVVLVGCGTAANAALTGRSLLARLARVSAPVVVGSEFAETAAMLGPGDLVIALSQSGETVDIIEGMLDARARGARLGAIVNVEQSTLDRMVDVRVHLGAGPEQCVLATKSYTAKVGVMLMLAHELAGTGTAGAALVRTAAAGLRSMLDERAVEPLRAVASQVHRAQHLFVVGRGLAYPSALEAALKIKEVSYIHAEGFAGGELKHGVIALIEQGTPCLVYAPSDATRADALSGAMEMKSRGGIIIGIGPEPDPAFDVHLPTPEVDSAFPIVGALPAQMIGYHAALARGNDPDRPRNLAKSVTVK
jgi:glucosamine--fructose-6-phosphate aminotransferase (isomerizing)